MFADSAPPVLFLQLLSVWKFCRCPAQIVAYFTHWSDFWYAFMIFEAQLAFFKKVRVVRATICLGSQVCGMFWAAAQRIVSKSCQTAISKLS